MTSEHKIIYLRDYTPPDYLVSRVDLQFDLDETSTRVRSRLVMRLNPDIVKQSPPLRLNGEHLRLIKISLNGKLLSKSKYTLDAKSIRLEQVPTEFTLDIETEINPKGNTALEGLYLSSGNFCTQCEAEGFRRITYFPDRPDVMARFTTTIVADRKKYPVLLAGGNLMEKGELDHGRHFVTWQDPFRKPSYLFALVAGDLVLIADTFRTRSGREVDLHIYVESRNRDKCAHAMASLKKAMQWDEDMYGREYDLDTYMIVAVDDFNMGAMENKGLNIFNSKYVLASPETATDADYEGIEGVIAHEYFHNWTGNRVTCRDWFQLSLKEGLTVFRDQEFSADMGSRPVQRITDVKVIRSFQFREDSGPMAHSIRPDSYMEINNFYTVTVYNKGAEVIRMIHTLLGSAGFRKGMDLYFRRHDGQAVTCEHFVRAMAAGGGINLDRFRYWYSQAGTPELKVQGDYDKQKLTYTLTFEQSCPATPGQEEKQPFHIPIAVGLLDRAGRDMTLRLEDESEQEENCTHILNLQERRQSYTFTDISEPPVPSILRNFSAPVKVKMDIHDEDLAFLLAHDSDSFNRWDAGQQFALRLLLNGIRQYQQEKKWNVSDLFLAAMTNVLRDSTSDPAFRALVLTLPAETWVAQQLDIIDPTAIFEVRESFRREISCRLEQELLAVYLENDSSAPYKYNALDSGQRSLKNICLSYLLVSPKKERISKDKLDLARKQYLTKHNMTDVLAALTAVVNSDADLGEELLADFYHTWRHDPLVVDKWLTIQAASVLPGALSKVKELMQHEAFAMGNPNKVRALIGSFCQLNQAQFHESGGTGYHFLADQVIKLDATNPQIAARLLTPLTTWRRFDEKRQALMKNILERIATKTTSGDVVEVVTKSLA